MSINLKMPDITELKPRITVFGVGGAGCNAVNNMIEAGLQGVDFVVANTDAQALTMTKADRLIQMGVAVTQGLGAGSQPEIGRAAAEETIDEINDHLSGAHMAFITAGMGGGTGTGAAPVVARAARESGILTVGVVTKPFQFEGQRRMRLADAGILELQKHVDTLIVIPNQNLFRIANDKTTFADAFAMADEVLYSGVACITDLMVKDGLINLDFADVRSVMREMGKAMMGTGEVVRRQARDRGGREGDLQPAARRRLHARRQGAAHLHHGRARHDAVRGGRGGEPRARGSRGGRQHHLRRHLRREPGRHHPRVGGGDRHRAGAGAGAGRAADGGHGRAHAPAEVGGRARRCRRRTCRAAAAAGDRAGLCAGRAGAGTRDAASPQAPQQRAAQRPAAAQPRPAGDPQVRIGPFRPDPSLVSTRHAEVEAEHQRASEAARAAAAAQFIPPAAERPEEVQARMPKVEDFPAVAQRQMRAQQAPQQAPEEDRRPRGLLARLASGLTRREDDDEPPRQSHAGRGSNEGEPRVVAARAPAHAASGGDAGLRVRQAGAAAPQRRAKRRRPVSSTRAGAAFPTEAGRDDQLEIPAFLRRQTS